MAVSKLVTFRRWLIGWIKNPWVDMVIGIFVLISAILEFAVEETHQLSGAKGLFLLGSWVVLKATLRLLESVDLLVDSAQHFYKKEKPRFLLRFNFIALIHIMIAILLVVIGVSEAIQEFDSEVALSQVWHWNLVLVGAMIMVKTTGELMDAIYFASKAAKKPWRAPRSRPFAGCDSRGWNWPWRLWCCLSPLGSSCSGLASCISGHSMD
jgi:hypothetical protein